MTRLLLISCSQCKRSDPQPLPALKRYTGGTYKVIGRAMREGYWPGDVEVLIISARYGLLSPEVLTVPYDQKITAARARELSPSIGCRLDRVLKNRQYAEVFLSMSGLYRSALAGSRELERLRLAGKVRQTTGGLGFGLRQTKEWLLALQPQVA